MRPKRRDRKALESFKARALRRLGEGTRPAQVARNLHENERYIQRKAQEWAREGLLVAAPRSSCRNYSLSKQGQIWLDSRGALTVPGAREGRTPAVKRPSDNVGIVIRPTKSYRRHRKKDQDPYYSGAHHWGFTARVQHPGEDLVDLLRDSYGGMRGQKKVRFGYLRVPGAGPFLVTRFRPKNRLRHGSVTIRFDLLAQQDETPFQLEGRAERLVRQALRQFERERRMKFWEPTRMGDVPHHSIGNDPDARDLVPNRVRVRTRDPFGPVWVDGSHGPEWEANHPRSAAARLRMAGNVEMLVEEARATREALEAIGQTLLNLTQAQAETTRSLQAIEAILKASVKPKPPPPPIPPPSETGPAYG